MKTVHDQIAEKLAKKFGTKYKSDKGIDLVLPSKVIEVETKKAGIKQGIKQIQRSNKARYLAVNEINIVNAAVQTQGTGIGVMGPTGKIYKKAGRASK